MSGLAKNFDKISSIYRDIAKNIYDPVLSISLRQLLDNKDDILSFDNILDLGCGNGNTLLRTQSEFPSAKFTGVDISKNMLEEASKKMALTTIQSDIKHIDNILPKHTFDLIFAHFVLGYVDLNTLLRKANYLLQSERYISIATNSNESFCGIKNIVKESCSKIKPLKYLINYKIKQGIKKSKNQINWDNIKFISHQHKFAVISLEKIKVECQFTNSRELFDYIFYGSWGIGELKPFIPIHLYSYCYTKFLNHLVDFPINDNAYINILLLKRID